ncbi:MAG: hypothetical protein MUO24_02130 [Desulfobacterales bacterium]|nr:hypothetical protein [Desulfobacterales bacterium]
MVRTGDELFGIDEFPADGRGAKRRLLPAIVEAVRYVTAPAYRLIFEDGREVIASADHRFIGRAKRGGSNTAWRAVHEFRRGDVLRRVVDPWGPPGYEEGWVGGLIDGEASLRTRTAGDGTNVRAGYGGGGHALNITQKPGAVYDRAVAYLTTHAYHFSEGLQCQREAWRQKPSTVGRINVHRADEIIRLLGQTRPSRLPKDWWHGCRLSGTNQDGWARLVSSETVGERSLIDLQTSTRTFVAEGLATHNCSFWNRNSWFYYSEPEYRKLYGIKADFEIISSEEKRVDRWKIIQDHVVAIKR